MATQFAWKRFWCSRDASFNLGDHGFLIDPDSEYGAALNPNLTTFRRLQTTGFLALLGEPGVGKSWSLSADVSEYLAESPGVVAIRLDLRSFGSEDRLYRALFEDPAFIRWTTSDQELHVYLDSFDECLLRIDTVAALLADELSKYPLHRLKLRIACRTASWPALLERALKASYGEASFAAAELVPLRRKDVLEAAEAVGIREPSAFLGRIDQLQLASLASKPVTLKMLIDTFQREGDLPTDLFSLYEKGCSIICEESNESRRAAGRVGSLSTTARLAVAARIAAVTQLGNRFAVWTGTEAQGVPAEDVSIAQLVDETTADHHLAPVSNEMILETLGTGLFSSRGEGRLGWSHQTFAEYLAARYCVERGLTIEQLKSLIFHPRRDRVIPQVREVASWLALQVKELFDEVAAKDPEVLLGSASPSLSVEQRHSLTTALLQNCDSNETLHVHHNLVLRNLAHPALSEQLDPVLSDRARPVATRYFAIQIIRECKVTTLGRALLGIALSDEEPHDLRSIAAHAVADLGTDDERDSLRPLLMSSREIDPDDQLKGSALSAVYPADKYDEGLWDYLESPRRPSFFGAYKNFLTYAVAPKLNERSLPAALRWCAKQSASEMGPMASLTHAIFASGVEHLNCPDVAEAFAAASFERCRSHQGLPRSMHSNRGSVEEVLQKDAVKRRQFLMAFLPYLNQENVHVLMFPLHLLNSEDLDWFVERILSGNSPDPAAEARIVGRLGASWETEAVLAVWKACQISPVIRAECSGLFEPVSLESEAAKWERRDRAAFLRENGIEPAPAMEPRIEAALAASEAGNADEWLRLHAEMSLEEGNTHYQTFREMKVCELPGWLSATDVTKSRIVSAAKAYLLRSTFPELEPATSGSVRNGAAGGIDALVFLQALEPSYLRDQPVDFWVRWVPSFIEDGRVDSDKNSELDEVFRLAADAAPDALNEHLLALIDLQNQGEQKYLFCSPMLDKAWSERLGELLFEKVRDNGLAPSIQATILSKLLLNEVPGTRDWAQVVIQSEHGTARGMAFARVLLSSGEDRAWGVLWPMIQNDAAFGRSLLEDFSYGRPDRSSFGSGFTEVELEGVYGWMMEQYPPVDERPVSGALGSRDTIRFLRDGALETLEKRGTFEACDAIARIELRFPQYKWLQFHFDEAEVRACAQTWEPPSPQAILTMAKDRNKRFVESNEQLLDVIVESLNRLQAELHSELPSVCDLWNNEQREWWPKDEESVSDYIARSLQKDLVGRGIVINREVQIRRGLLGEMAGQKTDIKVDAMTLISGRESQYGSVNVVIEVKGTWNDGLMTAMEEQLRDRYLRNSGCRTGLYVAAHFEASSWRTADTRRTKSQRWDIENLRWQLAEQAKNLTSSALIKSFVLDATLDSTTSTKIEEQPSAPQSS